MTKKYIKFDLPYHFICRKCNKVFYDKWGKSYCSNKCNPFSCRKIKRICQFCDTEFLVSKSRLKYGWGKYCSNKCSIGGIALDPIRNKKISIAKTGSGHHLWKGGKHKDRGY